MAPTLFVRSRSFVNSCDVCGALRGALDCLQSLCTSCPHPLNQRAPCCCQGAHGAPVRASRPVVDLRSCDSGALMVGAQGSARSKDTHRRRRLACRSGQHRFPQPDWPDRQSADPGRLIGNRRARVLGCTQLPSPPRSARQVLDKRTRRRFFFEITDPRRTVQNEAKGPPGVASGHCRSMALLTLSLTLVDSWPIFGRHQPGLTPTKHLAPRRPIVWSEIDHSLAEADQLWHEVD